MTFLDRGDYPLPDDRETLFALVEKMREVQPTVILTHSRVDPYNYDHPLAADLTLRARMVAQARGHESAYPPLGAPPVFRFEPHQPEMCEFTPDVLVDISAVFDRKLAAMRGDGLAGPPGPLLHRPGPAARRAGGAQRRAGLDPPGRGVRAGLPPGGGGAGWVTPVVVTGPPRTPSGLVAELGGYGVATVHEALGRRGLLGADLRPAWPGARAAGTAVTALCLPGDNLTVHVAVELTGPGDVLVVTTTEPSLEGYIGELLTTSLAARGVTGLVTTTGIRDVADDRRGRLPGLVAGGERPGHGQGGGRDR